VQDHRTRTTAGLLKVVAAIGEFETCVIAVARLVARALDNRVRRFFLNDAARVPALATELCGAAASGGGPVNSQGNQRGDDDQSGQPGRVFPPHSPRDSATLTTLALTATTTTLDYLISPTVVETPRTCRNDDSHSFILQRLVARAINRQHVDLLVPRFKISVPSPSERITLQL